MLIKFFANGKGAGAGPVGYLVAERVLAYDGNRDLIRDQLDALTHSLDLFDSSIEARLHLGVCQKDIAAIQQCILTMERTDQGTRPA